jgi:putative heme iron utilization protein
MSERAAKQNFMRRLRLKRFDLDQSIAFQYPVPEEWVVKTLPRQRFASVPGEKWQKVAVRRLSGARQHTEM